MLRNLAEWLWKFQENCPADFDPEPHWGRILRAWRWGIDPWEASSALAEGRLKELEEMTR